MLIFSSGLYAQKMNAVKTDLFSPFLRTGVIKYERAFNENISAQLGFFYTNWNVWGEDVVLNGWGITPEFRLYLSDTPAPQGTYLAPNIRYMSLTGKNTETDESATFSSFGFAFNLGKQWVLKDIVLIDAWVGPAYNFRTAVDESADVEVEILDGFFIRLGLALGIVF